VLLPTPLRYGGKKSTPISESNPVSSKSRKRSADGSSTANEQPNKKSKTRSALDQIKEGEGRSTPKPETQRQLESAHQICRYLLEMFSVPLLRSHATASLVDRDRLQLYHHWGQGPKYPPDTCWIHWEYRQQVTPMCPVGIDCIHFKCPLPWDSNLPRPEQAGYI